jgi:hypothetical protein
MSNRIDRHPIRNKHELYQDAFKKRAVKYIDHYPTPVMKEIAPELISSVEQITHIWSLGDKYYKLAYKYYGNTSWWWIIARFNNKPTEAHLNIGDQVYIPVPLTEAIKIMRA